MEMKPKFIMLFFCIVSNICFLNAQERSANITTPKQNERQLYISDNLALSIVDAFSSVPSRVATGSKISDEKFSAVFGIGYRYHINRLRIGAVRTLWFRRGWCGFYKKIGKRIFHIYR